MDEATFHAFYETTAGNLRGYIRSMLLSGNTADMSLVDDLLQESYFRLMNGRLSQEMEPAHRKNYLYRIATNLVRDHRRSRRMEPLPEDPPESIAPHSGDVSHDLNTAFGHLKPREREMLWMAYVEGFDHREIAATLRVRAASVRPMLFRARAKFADILRRRGMDRE